jgi:hypothetical protein
LRALLSPEKSHSATLNPLDVFSCFLSGKHANVKLAFFLKKMCFSSGREKQKSRVRCSQCGEIFYFVVPKCGSEPDFEKYKF